MTSMKILQFSRLPTPLSIYVQNFSTPCPWRYNTNTLPLQMITSQLKENMTPGWILYVIMSFFQVSFRFQYQLINFVWLSFDFFSFSWRRTISFFVALYSWVCSCQLCAVIHIFSTLSWLIVGGSNAIHQGEIYQDFIKWAVGVFLGHSLIIIKWNRRFFSQNLQFDPPPHYILRQKSTQFAVNLENINKLWNNNRTVPVNERNQNKNKTKSRHIQIDHAFYCSI